MWLRIITSVLYTGDNVLERISPRVIVLEPSEKLVIETRASGGYQWLEWSKNGYPFRAAGAPGTSPFIVTIQEFPNFFEIFVRDNTTVNDLGVYEVDLVVGTGQTQTQVPEVDFTVTPYSEYVCNCVCLSPVPESSLTHMCTN